MAAGERNTEAKGALERFVTGDAFRNVITTLILINAAILGLIWLLVGLAQLVYLTRFFRREPPEVAFEESDSGSESEPEPAPAPAPARGRGYRRAPGNTSSDRGRRSAAAPGRPCPGSARRDQSRTFIALLSPSLSRFRHSEVTNIITPGSADSHGFT